MPDSLILDHHRNSQNVSHCDVDRGCSEGRDRLASIALDREQIHVKNSGL